MDVDENHTSSGVGNISHKEHRIRQEEEKKQNKEEYDNQWISDVENTSHAERDRKVQPNKRNLQQEKGEKEKQTGKDKTRTRRKKEKINGFQMRQILFMPTETEEEKK